MTQENPGHCCERWPGHGKMTWGGDCVKILWVLMVGLLTILGLAKRYSDFVTFLENRLLSPAAHNMTVRKARESFRISNEQKDYIVEVIMTWIKRQMENQKNRL